MQESLTFDDVLLVPQYSDIESRSEVDVSVKLSKGIETKHPLIPANMKTIAEIDMCRAMYQSGGMSIVHRFMSIEDQIAIPTKLAKEFDSNVWNFVGLSVGVKKEDYNTVDLFAKSGAKILCVDVAHGHSKLCIDMCKYIASKYPNMFLIAGNVATAEGAMALWRVGVDAVKVNVGSGALCTTRIETGNGVAALSAIMDVAKANTRWKNNIWTDVRLPRRFIIADGGVKSAGDCVKALCFADLVMCGSLFAGTDECPGNILEEDGFRYKEYVGSSTHKSSRIEGVRARVPVKGKVSDVLQHLKDGIQSGCSYQGAHNLTELKSRPQFVRITNAGLIESHPHIKGKVL